MSTAQQTGSVGRWNMSIFISSPTNPIPTDKKIRTHAERKLRVVVNYDIRFFSPVFHRRRYAKMWEKGISLTADGCALIYLVDSAGTRTTSDAVNKDHRSEYCWQVFVYNARLGGQFFIEAQNASKNYHFFTQDDGTQVFDILGYRISQTNDGMVR